MGRLSTPKRVSRYRFVTIGPARQAVWAEGEHIGSIVRTPKIRRARDRQWTFTGAQNDYATREIAAHHLAARRREGVAA